MLLFMLMVLLQQGAVNAPGMNVTEPEDRKFGACIRPLSADGSASSEMVVTCTSVRNGRPEDCRLTSGQDNPVRHRTAARCLAREYRFTDAATGQPANGGPVTIPVSLNVQMR